MARFQKCILSIMLVMSATHLFAGKIERKEDIDLPFEFSKLIINKNMSPKEILEKCKNNKELMILINNFKLEEKAEEFKKIIEKEDIDLAKGWLNKFIEELQVYLAKIVGRDKQQVLPSLSEMAKNISNNYSNVEDPKKAVFQLLKHILSLKECEQVIPDTLVPAFEESQRIMRIGNGCFMCSFLPCLIILGTIVSLVFSKVLPVDYIWLSFLAIVPVTFGFVCFITAGFLAEREKKAHLEKYKKEIASKTFEDDLRKYMRSLEDILEEVKYILWKFDRDDSCMIDIDE